MGTYVENSNSNKLIVYYKEPQGTIMKSLIVRNPFPRLWDTHADTCNLFVDYMDTVQHRFCRYYKPKFNVITSRGTTNYNRVATKSLKALKYNIYLSKKNLNAFFTISFSTFFTHHFLLTHMIVTTDIIMPAAYRSLL